MYNEQNNNDLNNKEMQSNSESQETFDQQHEYITYGRRFISYKWYKPILVGLVLGILYLIIGSGAICALVMLNHEAVEASGVLLSGYENMDVSSVAGVMVNLGGLAILIPFLWIASKIVKDRPFSSYSSSRGGWNWKLFFKCFLIAIVIVGIPALITNLVEGGGDGINRFTVLSFVALTIMGPLQCIAEEYIFRGFFLQTIGSWVKIPIVAIVVSALVFTAGHPYKLAGVISVLVSGLIWGFMAKTTRGLEASSAAHIANNMAVFYTMGFGIVKLTAEIPVADMIVSVVKDAVYLIVIFIIARKTNWFNEVQADDVTAFNEKVEAKMAAKAAKN